MKGGGKFAMLCDLNLDPSEASVIIDTFGGLKTCVTQMQAALALRTGAKIVPVECRPQPDGTYRMVYRKPLDFPPRRHRGGSYPALLECPGAFHSRTTRMLALGLQALALPSGKR